MCLILEQWLEITDLGMRKEQGDLMGQLFFFQQGFKQAIFIQGRSKTTNQVAIPQKLIL